MNGSYAPCLIICSVLHVLQEQGDLKLRVRNLESERAFQRVSTMQKVVGSVSVIFFVYSH